MKKFIIENKNLVILWVLCAIALFIFCGHYSNILLDVGREVYYPERILAGKVLYKDLFNIYAPFSYLFNALLYKVFVPNLGVLYFAGICCSFAIVSGIYFIAKKFLSEFLSFSLGIFTIVTGVCACHLFNFTLPYSFGMLYGTVALIYSLLALIKYKQENKTQYLYLAALLGGICVANKYDFLIYGLYLFVIALMSKNKKIILNFITCFMFVPVICSLTLYFQGLRIADLLPAITDIKYIISSKTLENFYKLQGIYFDPKIIILWIINLLKTGFCFGGIILGIKLLDRSKVWGYILTGIFVLVTAIVTSVPVFIFMVPLIIITMMIVSGELVKDVTLFVFSVGVLSVCAKCFWALLAMNYGNYTISLILVTFLALLFKRLDRNYEKAFAIGLLAVSLNFLVMNSGMRVHLNSSVSTDKGVIYTYEKNAHTTNALVAGLMQNKPKHALIYPEGLLVNFLSGITADDYYNSLIPLYVESMGEERIINGIEKIKPEYIVLASLDLREYGAGYICDDYAQGVCRYLFSNYSEVDRLDDGFQYFIFARNN